MKRRTARVAEDAESNGEGTNRRVAGPHPVVSRKSVAWRLAVVSATVMGVAACGETPGGKEEGNSIVHDSAGVTIVETTGDIWSTPQRRGLSGDPVVRIGAVEGEASYLFDGVRGIVCLDDGRIVVANGGTNTLRWFDDEGGFLFEKGGSGEGPGEFSRLGAITSTAGDTILAVDWAGWRAITFGPDGSVLSSTILAGLPGPPGAVFRTSDGSYITGVSGFSSSQLPPNQGPGILRVPSPLIRLSGDGTRADTLGMFPSMEVWVREQGGGIAFGPPPFARTLEYAVTDDRVYVGTGDPFQIDVYSSDGQLLRSIRAPDVDLTLGEAVRNAYRDEARARLTDLPEEQRAEAERSIGSTLFPDALPAYRDFLLDREGNLWVNQYVPGTSGPGRWAVFDPEGHLREVIETPPRFTLLAVTDDRVWGRETDDLGVQYVVAYAIGPAAGVAGRP